MAERGHTLAEIVTALAIAALAAGLTLPSLSGLRERAALSGASSEVATLLASTRLRSVAEGRNIAIVFERLGSSWMYTQFLDGDGDGVRSSDISEGTDPPMTEPICLRDRWDGVDFGTLPLPRMRQLPPGTGWTAPPADPIQFGAVDAISFSPQGDASSGTLFITDGHAQQAAIVLFGPTVRIRAFRYDLDGEVWVP